MSKKYVHTYDTFEHDDVNIRIERYIECFKIARYLGIVAGKERKDSTVILYLNGSKFKICLYYLLTVSPLDNKNISDVFKRVYYIMNS